MSEKKARQLNYELLRILAMLMIVCLHYLSKGGLLGDPMRADMSSTGYMAWFIEALCLVSVNVYVLISGYFGVGEQTAPLKKRNVLERPLKIWLQVLFYSVLIGAAVAMISGQGIDIYQIFGYIFPIVTEHYWFATAYIILCFLMPFLNAGFAYLDKKGIQAIIFAMLIVFSISKTVIPMQLPWDKYGYDAYWFVVLYLTGGYLRRYGTKLIVNRLRAVVLYLTSELLIFGVFIALRTIYLKTGSLGTWALTNYSYSYNHFLCYTGAIGLFLAFKAKGSDSIKLERLRKPIELFAGATFGVYLIHEHINLRGMWQEWFNCGEHINSSAGVFLLYMLVTVLCVYLVCSLTEIVRIKLTNRENIKYLLAFILFVYPLRKVTMGIDLMDAGYALGNYRFFDTMNETWKLATYLANATGMLLLHLPFGNTWAGMNFYTSLFIGTTSSGVYLFFVNKYGDKSRYNKYVLFGSEFTAISLCWAPSVILYHYMGYIMMTASSIILFKAIIKNNTKNYIIAGVILGFAVAVRMPNITYMAFILPLWYYYAFGENKNFAMLLKRTLYCVAGYCVGLITPVVYISIRYGMNSYPKMISALFGMTETATDYKPTSMITAMFDDYIRYSAWLLLFLGYMILGLIAFKIKEYMLSKSDSKLFDIILKIAYIAGLLVLLRLCYGRGMFNFDYTWYFSMYKWVTVYLLIVIALCIWLIFYKNADTELKLWSVFTLVTIFITPLGSNNRLHPIINNLFLVAPVSVLLVQEAFTVITRFKGGVLAFPFRSVLVFVLVCTAVQSILFGVGFVFHDDAPNGGMRTALRLESTDTANGLMTTADKKEELEALDAFLIEKGLTTRQLITFGDIPALSYIFDMQPAVYTTWADLDSNPLSRLNEELNNIKEDYPIIIMGTASIEQLIETDGVRYEKLKAIEKFIQDNEYLEIYSSKEYQVYVAGGFE